MLLRNTAKVESGEEDGSTMDPNTYHWPGSGEGGSSDSLEETSNWLPISRNGPVQMPPTLEPWPRIGNLSVGPDKLQVLGVPDPVVRPVPNTAICDILLNAPVPPPVDQIPFFCICSHCRGTVGPKGDRGDRGPPGT